jgi:hypothetical protein
MNSVLIEEMKHETVEKREEMKQETVNHVNFNKPIVLGTSDDKEDQLRIESMALRRGNQVLNSIKPPVKQQ